ncbi:hypothetical protein ACN6LB_001849, partial [Streptomyces sp. SAS_270]
VPKSEVEELVLEEVPDIGYEQIGGLGGQIEMIRDAVELPYLYPDLFKEGLGLGPSPRVRRAARIGALLPEEGGWLGKLLAPFVGDSSL